MGEGMGAADEFPWSVGVLGIGGTGPALVRRLLHACPTTTRIVVWGPDRKASTELVSTAGERAATPADLAARSTVVLVEFPGPDDLSELMTGPLGFQAGVYSPTRLVATGAGPTDTLQDLALRAQYQTAGLLRLVHASFSSDLSVPHDSHEPSSSDIGVSGSDDDYRVVAPVVRLFGRPVHTGPLRARACGHAQP